MLSFNAIATLVLFGAAANIVSFTFILVSVRLSTSQTIRWKPGDTWVILSVSTALSFVISEPLLSDPGEKACKTPVAKPSGGSFPCHDLSHSPKKKPFHYLGVPSTSQLRTKSVVSNYFWKLS